MTAFAEAAVTYVDLAGEPWGSFRLFVGGKDVTYFRGVPVQIGGYQLTEPYSFGPADFNLPQITAFEVDEWESGSLPWMGTGKKVVLKQVDASGSVVRDVWRGFISLVDVTLAGTRIHCEGEAQGRLNLLPKLPDPFQLKRTVGRKIYDAFKDCRLTVTPFLGGDIGVNTDGRGMTGGTHLDYVNNLLAATIAKDGTQYTLTATDTGAYELALKDTTTVDFTAFLGAHGVDPDLSRDMSEEPNMVYGSGVAPSGLVWANVKAPHLVQGTAPDYPMTDSSSFGEGTTDADTDSGDGVTIMIWQLIGTGYMPRTAKLGGYDADVTDAIEDLQDDAGLTVSGDMNTDTWDALFNTDVTGFSLLDSFVAPMAQRSVVKKWNRTSNGSLLSRNPDYDPSVIPVGIAVDHGAGVEKKRAWHWSQGVLHRVANSENWAGTITLTSDVFTGAASYTDTDLAPMSRLDITAGMNMRLKHFNNNQLFHVSVVNVASDLSVQLGVDTQARDAATLGEVIARNIESRSHPARLWKRAHRADVNLGAIQFGEIGGQIFNKISVSATTWTVIPVVAGQAGTINRIRLQTTSDPAAFVMALFAQKVSPAWLNHHIGDPFDTNADGESKWTNAGIQSEVDDARSLLGAWGDDDNPCGYYPRHHTGEDGTTTDATITGLFLEDAGIDYHTFGQPVVYLCVYAKTATTIKPQRVLWPTEETDA